VEEAVSFCCVTGVGRRNERSKHEAVHDSEGSGLHLHEHYGVHKKAKLEVSAVALV